VAATRDLDMAGGAVVTERNGPKSTAPESNGDVVGIGAGASATSGNSHFTENTWHFVTSGGHPVQGGGKVGWRVLGDDEVDGTAESGVLQGL
jgi:hypothetical protein